MMEKKWSSVNRVGKRGLMKGVWLKDPDGNPVATFADSSLAGQCAAAMNLTTMKQRTDYCATQAGYKSPK